MSKKSEYILSDGEIDFYDWRDYGIKQRWITKPICVTHDWFEVTDEESEMLDADEEVCIFASRYNEKKFGKSLGKN